MAYWNGNVHGCDFAFDSVGVIISLTVDRLEKEADLVIDKKYPEQSMLALLKVLDLLIDEFPKCASLSFGKREYAAIKQKFQLWRESFGKIPKKHRASFDESVQKLFEQLDQKLKINDN